MTTTTSTTTTSTTTTSTKPRAGILEKAKDAKGKTYYRGKVYLHDGTLARVQIPEPKCYSETAARDFVAFCQEEEDTTHAVSNARAAKEKRARTRAVHGAGGEGETVSAWFGRYYDWRAGKATGGESARESHGRFTKWVTPKLGTIAMSEVTRDDLEAFVAFLDGEVAAEVISWKSASNIWGEVTAGFGVATKGKDKSLRVLSVNPCASVAGPDKGDEKIKPFLRPDEISALLGCDDVPLERRRVYAMAIYTAMRQGELRAHRVSDVDLDAMQIAVSKTRKGGVEKARTKTGRARVVNIEPNLVPLLRVLVAGKEPEDHVLDVRAHNRCASNLRADLLTAGVDRSALHLETEMAAHLTFHNLRDTCLTHMAVRRDPPQDVQWRAGHTTSAMTEKYIASARYQAGATFGVPLPPLPRSLLGPMTEPSPPETTFQTTLEKSIEKTDKAVEAPGIEVCRARNANMAKSLASLTRPRFSGRFLARSQSPRLPGSPPETAPFLESSWRVPGPLRYRRGTDGQAQEQASAAASDGQDARYGWPDEGVPLRTATRRVGPRLRPHRGLHVGRRTDVPAW